MTSPRAARYRSRASRRAGDRAAEVSHGLAYRRRASRVSSARRCEASWVASRPEFRRPGRSAPTSGSIATRKRIAACRVGSASAASATRSTCEASEPWITGGCSPTRPQTLTRVSPCSGYPTTSRTGLGRLPWRTCQSFRMSSAFGREPAVPTATSSAWSPPPRNTAEGVMERGAPSGVRQVRESRSSRKSSTKAT